MKEGGVGVEEIHYYYYLSEDGGDDDDLIAAKPQKAKIQLRKLLRYKRDIQGEITKEENRE